MNPTSKKIVLLFLVFFLLLINCAYFNMAPREHEIKDKKHGSTLIIQKKDNSQISGELVLVRENWLLLSDTNGRDLPINIADIVSIKIMKKSRVLKGALEGFVGLGITVTLIVGSYTLLSPSIREEFNYEDEELLLFSALTGLVAGAAGALIGASSAALAGKYEIIHIEGMTEQEIQEALDYLRKKARVRDYK